MYLNKFKTSILIIITRNRKSKKNNIKNILKGKVFPLLLTQMGSAVNI